MWEQLNGARRYCLIMGTSYVLGAFALLTVMLTIDLSHDAFNGLLVLCVILGFSGPFLLYLVGKEAFMKIGIVERIMERRRIASVAGVVGMTSSAAGVVSFSGLGCSLAPQAGHAASDSKSLDPATIPR